MALQVKSPAKKLRGLRVGVGVAKRRGERDKDSVVLLFFNKKKF